MGAGAWAGTQQAALVAVFGADSPQDGDTDLDDGTMVKTDNFGDSTTAEVWAIRAK